MSSEHYNHGRSQIGRLIEVSHYTTEDSYYSLNQSTNGDLFVATTSPPSEVFDVAKDREAKNKLVKNFMLAKATEIAGHLGDEDRINVQDAFKGALEFFNTEVKALDKKLLVTFRQSNRKDLVAQKDELEENAQWLKEVVIISLEEYQRSTREKHLDSFLERHEKEFGSRALNEFYKEEELSYRGKFLQLEHSLDNDPIISLQVDGSVKSLMISQSQANELSYMKKGEWLSIKSPEMAGTGKHWHITSDIGKGRSLG